MKGKTNAQTDFGLEVGYTGTAISFSYDYLTAAVTDVRNGSVWRGYEFHAFGTIIVGATNSALTVTVIDGGGRTSSDSMTITGNALITLVGSVS